MKLSIILQVLLLYSPTWTQSQRDAYANIIILLYELSNDTFADIIDSEFLSTTYNSKTTPGGHLKDPFDNAGNPDVDKIINAFLKRDIEDNSLNRSLKQALSDAVKSKITSVNKTTFQEEVKSVIGTELIEERDQYFRELDGKGTQNDSINYFVLDFLSRSSGGYDKRERVVVPVNKNLTGSNSSTEAFGSLKQRFGNNLNGLAETVKDPSKWGSFEQMGAVSNLTSIPGAMGVVDYRAIGKKIDDKIDESVDYILELAKKGYNK